MNFRQKLAILFFLKRSKTSKDNKITIYVRVTIDGLIEDFSSGCKVLDGDWDSKTKQVLPTDKSHKEINKKLRQIQTDLERHFDLVQAKEGLATPVLVLESYKTPINGVQIQEEKVQNLAFSEALDSLVTKYVRFCYKKEKAYEFDQIPSPEKKFLLDTKEAEINKELAKVVKLGNAIFDKKTHKKTFILAVDEYMLNFLQLCTSDDRSPNSLEKFYGRKRRYVEFIRYRYKKQDIYLADIEYKFITDLNTYLLVQRKLKDISASKYAQTVKEITDRAVSNGWLNVNLFDKFKCTFRQPKRDWLEVKELKLFEEHQFDKPILNLIRDVFLFSSYTGFPYREVYNLGPHHLKQRDDGLVWASLDRQKTDEEEGVPLLPPAIQLIEKYKDDPESVRRKRLFPVPSNQEYNKGLKEITAILNITDIVLKTHKARFYFANEVTYNNGVELKTVSRLLGHQSIKTTEIYVQPNTRNLSENMKMVKEKLFNDDGKLKSATPVVEINNPLKVVHIANK